MMKIFPIMLGTKIVHLIRSAEQIRHQFRKKTLKTTPLSETLFLMF